ncbi:MAG: hypothetical protein ACR2IE_06875 [Candidatus Sumerlaeaceae bacterium]
MILRSASAIFASVLLLCLLTTGGHLYSPDEEIMFRVTESLATRGALDVEPIRDPAGGTFATKAGINGLEYAQYGVGNSLAAVPLYWLGALACKMIPDSRAEKLLHFQTTDYVPDAPLPGHARLKRFMVSFLGALIAAATAALLWKFAYAVAPPPLDSSIEPDEESSERASELNRRRAAGLVALTYILATMAWPQSRTFFSEPLATFFCLLSFYYLAVPGPASSLTHHRAFLSGMALAAALLTRMDSAIVLPAIALLMLSRLPTGGVAPIETSTWRDRIVDWVEERFTWTNIATLFTFGLPVLAFGLWYFAMNHIHFGDAFTTAYADQREGVNFTTPALAGLYGFFMSIGKSMFLFSPGMLLGIAGYAAFRRNHPALAWSLLLVIALKIFVHSKWQNWAGGWCWGPRHIFLIHPFAILPAVAFFAAAVTIGRRLLADAVLLVGIFVQLYGCSQNFIDYYILYFRTPATPPIATVMYAADDTAPGIMRLLRANPGTGQMEPVSFAQLVAPINDSIYVPQNSQWYRYAEMWDRGYTDNLWLRLLQRSSGKEPPIR